MSGQGCVPIKWYLQKQETVFFTCPFEEKAPSWSVTSTRYERQMWTVVEQLGLLIAAVSLHLFQMQRRETQLKWAQRKWSRGEGVFSDSGNLTMGELGSGTNSSRSSNSLGPALCLFNILALVSPTLSGLYFCVREQMASGSSGLKHWWPQLWRGKRIFSTQG